MAYTVDVYKGVNKLGSGSMTNASKSLTSYTGTAPGSGRNVQITAVDGSNIGASVATRVVTDATTTLTLQDVGPFSS